MEFKDLKEKFVDTEIKDRQYRIISVLIDGSSSSWKKDIKLELLADEYKLRQFTVAIQEYLTNKGVNLPYSVYKSKREGLSEFNANLYIKNVKELKEYLDEKLGEFYG